MSSFNLTIASALPPSAASADRVAEQRALDTFLRGVERRALRMAELATGNRDDALEVVQDCMLGFVRRYAQKPASDWAPLFYSVLDSRLNDFHRRSKVRRRWLVWFTPRKDDDEQCDPLEAIADPALPDPMLRSADGETAAALDVALKALPLRQRQAFLLRVWEGLDVAQTACAMGCGEGSVKTHLSRAMQALRARLEDYL